MKCVRCGHDCTYPQRRDRKCPGCGGKFAFEPREGDPVTDTAFKNAVDAVSSQGSVRWGLDNLYYEVCRRKRGQITPNGCLVVLLVLSAVAAAVAFAVPKTPALWLIPVGLWVVALIGAIQRMRSHFVAIPRERFGSLWDTWCRLHGAPEGLIVRLERPVGLTTRLEPDLGDYSFDRAVICDRAETVDLLLANNFHFENNCAVLSVDFYPPGPFETVRAMLKRNPNLQVFALHDAKALGCRLANRLATDPDWFAGSGCRVVDLGLRPDQAAPFRGLFQHAEEQVSAGEGIADKEAEWLSAQTLEVAAVRPEQVLKRLFHAINRTAPAVEPADAAAAAAAAGVGTVVVYDSLSFGDPKKARTVDAGIDSFG